MKNIIMLEELDQDQMLRGKLVEVATPVGTVFIGMEITAMKAVKVTKKIKSYYTQIGQNGKKKMGRPRTKFTCGDCDHKPFKNERGLNVHRFRIHHLKAGE